MGSQIRSIVLSDVHLGAGNSVEYHPEYDKGLVDLTRQLSNLREEVRRLLMP